jgi:acetyl-CoA acetyltransferase family protein
MPHIAYIVDGVRTAGDDVIFGCVSQIGAQAGNIGRNVVLSSKVLPQSVPGTSVDRQCGSSQQAIHFAVQAVMSGTQDVVIAGGVEVMSLIPIGSNIMDGAAAGRGMPKGKVMEEKWPGVMFSQFEGAEIVADKFNVTKEEMDKFGVISHKRAAEATKKGHFANEIVTVKGFDKKTNSEVDHSVDEGIRPDTTLEGIAKLPLLKPDGGRLTAGTASQICDGSAAMLIVNERALKKYNLKPRAKFISLALAGDDPVMMLGGPIPATIRVLQNAGLTINDIDLYEVNEAFASVPLAWMKAVGADFEKLNVNGGAMALGHPLGGTGAKIMITLLNELERRGKRYGLQAICEGGGTANATIIEIVNPQSSL